MNPPVPDEFPSQMVSNKEIDSILRRHRGNVIQWYERLDNDKYRHTSAFQTVKQAAPHKISVPIQTNKGDGAEVEMAICDTFGYFWNSYLDIRFRLEEKYCL